MEDIPKAIREELPETADGLREFIRLAEQSKLSGRRFESRLKGARMLLAEKTAERSILR